MLIDQLGALRSKTIVLASQSPRRREILSLMGLQYVVEPSTFAEDLPKADFPDAAAYATATAHAKAAAVAARRAADPAARADLVIGSDTVVVVDGAVVEKPASEGDAVCMLRALSGRSHNVVTAVSLIAPPRPADPAAGRPARAQQVVRKFASTTQVWFGHINDDIISAYVRHGEPMDKAGAYGIQGVGGAFVSRIDGCYFTVMGLPMHELSKHIRALIEEGVL